MESPRVFNVYCSQMGWHLAPLAALKRFLETIVMVILLNVLSNTAQKDPGIKPIIPILYSTIE